MGGTFSKPVREARGGPRLDCLTPHGKANNSEFNLVCLQPTVPAWEILLDYLRSFGGKVGKSREKGGDFIYQTSGIPPTCLIVA